MFLELFLVITPIFFLTYLILYFYILALALTFIILVFFTFARLIVKYTNKILKKLYN